MPLFDSLFGGLAASQTKEILSQLKNINMKLDEAIAKLNEISTQVSKATAEILAKLEELSNIDPGTLTPEQAAIIEDLKAKVQRLDDIVPDAQPTPPEAA